MHGCQGRPRAGGGLASLSTEGTTALGCGGRIAPFTAAPSVQVHPRALRYEHDTRRKLFRVIELMEKKYGLERLLFVTGTFPDEVFDRKEAYRRFHSFSTNVLSKTFPCWVLAVGRHKDERIHYHLLAVAPVDVRTGFDFVRVDQGDYRSACPWLRALWKRMRHLTNYNGKHPEHPYPKIGRFEFLPIRVSAGAVARYVGRYMRNQFGTRFPQDKGARLARFSRAAQELDAEYWLGVRGRVAGFCRVVRTMAQRIRSRRRQGATCSRVEWRPEFGKAFGLLEQPEGKGGACAVRVPRRSS